jgi:hypothetical protein
MHHVPVTHKYDYSGSKNIGPFRSVLKNKNGDFTENGYNNFD